MMKDGIPCTDENGSVDDRLLIEVSEKEQKAVLQWVAHRLTPDRRVNTDHTSYGMKHLCEHETGIDLTGSQFKDAMRKAGYRPGNANELNWHYRVSNKLPAFAEHVPDD